MYNKKSKTICFIPARGKSNRILNKNLKKINNKTLIEITINQAKRSGVFRDIILSSNSEKILSIGKKLKINCLKRSQRNSKHNSTTDSALKETVLNIRNDYENIVILQVTSPLRKISTIKKFISFCKYKKLDHCLTVSKFTDNLSYYNKYYFNSLIKKRQRSQTKKPFIYENGLIYFISRKKFIKNFKIFPKKNWNYFLTNKYESLDINELQDLKVCKLLNNKI